MLSWAAISEREGMTQLTELSALDRGGGFFRRAEMSELCVSCESFIGLSNLRAARELVASFAEGIFGVSFWRVVQEIN